jgi:hypothetical protein
MLDSVVRMFNLAIEIMFLAPSLHFYSLFEGVRPGVLTIFLNCYKFVMLLSYIEKIPNV